jgi:hypothetical protein
MARIMDRARRADDQRRQAAAVHRLKQPKRRWWKVRDAASELVCLTIYRRGAREVAPG